MKRIFIPGLMLSAAFALTNCTEQLVSPVQEEDVIVDENAEVTYGAGSPFEVGIEDFETKTATTSEGRTYWVNGDLISLYSADHGSKEKTYHHHDKFAYKSDKKNFYGVLSSELARYNDWYAIYPYNPSTLGTLTAEMVTIGAPIDAKGHSVQGQTGANNKDHIDGGNYPLYGIKNNVAKSKTPKFKMSPLFSLIALEVVNNSDGAIVVANAEFKATEDIVGEFDINILGTEKSGYLPVFTPVKGKTSQVARLELDNPISLAAGSSATLYFAVKPFEVQSGKEIIISLNGTASKGNGVSKAVKMEANTKFEGGMMTKFSVPVEELSFGSTVTNVTGIQGTTASKFSTSKTNAVSFGNYSTENILINGKEVQAYVIGTDSKVGTVAIKGTAKELFPYIPIEFYASSWNGEKAVMRVEKIKASYKLLVYWAAIEMGFTELCNYMAASKIQFSGVLPLEQYTYNNKKNLVILDEEPYHKKISREQIENLLQNFDDDKKDGKTPTFDGLSSAIMSPSSLPSSKDTPLSSLTSEADITAKIIFDKIYAKIGTLGTLGDLAGIIFNSPKAMFEQLGTMPLEVTLSTVAKGGSEGATDNRIVVWGLNSPNVQ